MSITFNTYADPGSISGEQAQGAKNKHSLTFTAISTSATDTDIDVMAAGPYANGSFYRYNGDSDNSSICKRISPKQDAEQPKVWRVTYEFDNEIKDGDKEKPENGDPGDPLSFTPDISWKTELVEKTAWRATLMDNGQSLGSQAVTNSAGGRFAQPLMYPVARVVLTVSRNEAAFNPAAAVTYASTCNDDVFYGQPRGIALLKSITGSKVYQRYGNGMIGYWKVSYEVHFDRKGWDVDILDQGEFVKVLDGGTYKKKTPRDKDGIPMSSFVLLDGAGGELSEANVNAGNVKYRTYRIYEFLPFQPLGIEYPLI